MEIRQAEHFLAVVDNGGLTRAASALYISQPSLSLSIRTLEERLGTSLFIRTGRRLVLSEAGENLVPGARRVLASAADATRAVREVRELQRGELTIAVDSELLDDPFASVIGPFCRTHPGVVIEVIDPATSIAPFRLVHSGRCEAEFSTTAATGSGLECVGLGRQRLSLVAAESIALPHENPVRLRDLAAVPMVLPPPSTVYRERVEASFALAKIRPLVIAECGPRELIWPLVQGGIGASIMPPSMVAAAVGHGMQVRSTEPPIEREVYLVHRTGVVSAALGRLLELVSSLYPPGRVR
ncbi:MAG: transcriptional regulator, LysR family [Nocardia sp.]|uniref:LysR family transcriptional regulator n=1 Tax=Nocardia sp. TaxID=1821 RepID=UPI002614E550|nr:LysR family transcriptional regulator [Nocardia sp.]MCU1642550.1 transcriptional regulator, LysR family [Nocardia sp.]